jgi:hypothetical protein
MSDPAHTAGAASRLAPQAYGQVANALRRWNGAT